MQGVSKGSRNSKTKESENSSPGFLLPSASFRFCSISSCFFFLAAMHCARRAASWSFDFEAAAKLMSALQLSCSATHPIGARIRTLPLSPSAAEAAHNNVTDARNTNGERAVASDQMQTTNFHIQ